MQDAPNHDCAVVEYIAFSCIHLLPDDRPILRSSMTSNTGFIPPCRLLALVCTLEERERFSVETIFGRIYDALTALTPVHSIYAFGALHHGRHA